MKTKREIKVGDKVLTSGFKGVVVRVTENAMIEVRLPGGVACLDPNDVTVLF